MLKSKNKTLLARAAITLLFALLTTVGAWAQETLTIYENGTATNSNVPVHGLWADAYLKCEFVVPADELSEMKGGPISQMTFYLSSPAAAAWTGTFKVFLMEVDDATISAYYGSDDATVVYEGQLDGTQSTMTIEFSDTYTYGGGNLLVGVYQIEKGNYKGCTFIGQTVTGASVQGYSSSSLDAISASQKNFIPKTTFTYTPGGDPTCAKPSTFEVPSITSSDATFVWEDTGADSYTFEYKKATESEWTVVNGLNSNTYSLSSLVPGTNYNARVKAVCGTDLESGYKSTNFTTECGAITSFPWSEDFEGYNAGDLTDPCWVNEHISGDGTYIFKVYSSSSGHGDNTTKILQLPDMKAGTLTKLVLPLMTLPADNYAFVLDIYRSNNTYNETYAEEGIRVFVSTNGDIEGATELAFIPRQYNVSSDAIPAEGAIGWYTYELPIGISGECYIILRGESQYNTSTYMDNFFVREASTCAKPTGLTVSDVTAHGATLNWVSDASAWQIMLNDDEENLIDVTEKPYTLTGLTAEKTYSVKVRTNCGGTYSEWTNPVSFTTDIACTAPTGITLSNITGHGVTVTWDEVEGAMYQYVMVKNEYYDPDDINWSYPAEVHTLTWDNLEPETEYVFCLRKDCSSAEDGFSDIVTRNFTTTIACPAPTVTVSNITTTTAVVSCTNTEADLFNVMLGEELVGENVAMPYTLTDLDPSTSYTVKVQAICGDEEVSEWSSCTFMTADVCPDGMVCIGTGITTSSYLPAYNYYKYSYSQQIYTADEIGMDGQISSIEFKNTGAEKTMTCNIYMTATNKTAFESTSDWVPLSDDDLVFSGEITFAVGEWTSIELENPFEYDGTSNLLVTIANVSGTYSGSPHMACLTFPATNQALYAYRDSPGAYDITAPGVTGTRPTYKNRVRFAIGEPPACAKPKNLEVSEIGSKSVRLSWTPGAEGQNAWQICVNGDEDNLIEADTNPFTLTGLTPETEYTVKVRANCGDDGFSDWSKEVTFTTDIACPAPTNLMASNISTSSATLSWNSLSNNTELRYAANSYQVFQGYVTNPGAMADGSDASWVQGDQSTWGPGVQYTRGNMLADDFTVYTPIKLSEIEVYGYQTGSTTTSTFTGLYAQIFDGNPADGGTAIWGDMDTNIMTGTSFTNCYRGTNGNANGMTRPIMAITASNLNIDLEPGTYWLVYSLEGTESSGPWGVPNAEPNVGNTGEGLQYTSSNWTYLVDSDSYTSYGCAMKLTFGEDIESLDWTYVNNINGEEYNLTNLDPNTPYIVQIRFNYGDDGNSTWVSTYFYTLGTAEITFAAEGYATYFNGLQDAVLPAGMKAKIVTVAEAAGSEDATLTYDIVANGDYADGNVVPKKTAVMLQVAPVSGTATQKKTIILTMPSAAAINKTNLLYGSDEEMEIEDHPSYADDNYYYMLSYDTNNENIGWYWGAAGGGSFTSLAHKAWLALPNYLFPSQGGAPFLGLPGWEETTGIVPVGVNPEDGEWYTLQGLKIGKKPTTKGVYIHNGRKFVVK